MFVHRSACKVLIGLFIGLILGVVHTGYIEAQEGMQGHIGAQSRHIEAYKGHAGIP